MPPHLLLLLGLCAATYALEADLQTQHKDWPICELGGRYDVAHNVFCDRYFTCLNGHPFLRECEDGLGFVPHKGCKLLHLVNCAHREKLQAPKGSGDCPRLYGLHAHPKGCGFFLQCDKGRADTQRCPLDLVFDPETKHCRAPRPLERHECFPPPPPPGPSTTAATPAAMLQEFQCPKVNSFPFGDHSRHPHPFSCAFFIMCLRDGSQMTGTCERGKAFSKITQNCEKQEDVDVSNCKI